MIVATTNYGLRGLVQVSVVEEGRVVRAYPQDHNLILNQGLDQIATTTFIAATQFAVAGTGSSATEIDGASNTVNIVSGAATFSTVGFLAGNSSDVGKSIKLTSSGHVYQVVAFSSTTQCSVTPAVTEGPDNFVVYMTEQTGLDTEVKRTNTYLAGAPNCQTLTVGGVTTLTRTYDFTAEVGPQSYNEVGFSNTPTPGSNLFSRFKLPSTVSLIAGQQLRVLYSLQITVTPSTPQTYAVSPIIGWSGATGQLQCEEIPIAAVSPIVDGKTYNAAGDPSSVAGVVLNISRDATALVTYGTPSVESNVNTAGIQAGVSSYVSGSYQLDRFCQFPVGQANDTLWRCYYLGTFASGSSQHSIMRFLFDTPQTKLSTFTLTLGFRATWNRLL